MSALCRWLDRQINQHRLVRRALLVWACAVITWVIIRVFTSPPDISGGTAAALATVVGILTAVIGFYQWSRAKEDERAACRKEDKQGVP